MYFDAARAGTDAGQIGDLLGIKAVPALDDVDLADHVSRGLMVSSADALSKVLGKSYVVGALIPEATLRRAKTNSKPLSKEMSERLYEVSRVVVAARRIYHQEEAAQRFLNTPHVLLKGKTPLDMARSSSAGAEAVIKLLCRADAGFAL